MPAGLALLAAALVAASEKAPPDAAPPPLVTYELVESTRSVTPAGERTVSTGGTVAVRDSRAPLGSHSRHVPALLRVVRRRERGRHHATRPSGEDRSRCFGRGFRRSLLGAALGQRRDGARAPRRDGRPPPRGQRARLPGPSHLALPAGSRVDRRRFGARAHHALEDRGGRRRRDGGPARGSFSAGLSRAPPACAGRGAAGSRIRSSRS